MKKIISRLGVLLAGIVLFGGPNYVSYASSVSSQNINSAIQNKLDVFLNKVVSMESEFSNDEQYEAFLDSVITKLQGLGSKYSGNAVISEMINYLETGLKKAKTEFVQNKAMNSFFCELNDNCGKNTTSTQTTTINTNVTPSTTPVVTPSTNTTDSTVLLSGISHKVEGYDLSKSNYTYNYQTMKLTSKSLGITYDFSLNVPEGEVYNSVIQAEDFCKSKGKGYRLPKSYELKSIYDLKSSIDTADMRRYDTNIPNGFYKAIRNDNNPNVGGGHILVPDFISLEVLQKIVRGTPVNGTIAVDLPSGNNLDNYFKMLFRIGNDVSLVKNDDDSYYMIRSDNYSSKVEKNPTYSYNMPSISSVLCVVDEK
ncbi:MAG: hypothetical protein AB7E37_01200 [Candidatus Altimarinota bacterium]